MFQINFEKGGKDHGLSVMMVRTVSYMDMGITPKSTEDLISFKVRTDYFCMTDKSGGIVIRTSIDMFLLEEKITVLRHVSDTVFQTNPFEIIDNVPQIPTHVIEVMISVSVTHARALFFEKSARSSFSNLIMPLIYPKSLAAATFPSLFPPSDNRHLYN